MVEVLRRSTDFVNVLPLLALMGTASAYNLTCHCLNDSKCETNGFCANGCANGWSGPGCQVGNVALGKAARQSTTYVEVVQYPANFALDGIIPDSGLSDYCSHTDDVQLANGAAWWFVTLDATNYYVITNITLVNRRGSTSNRLSNFVILYSNETEGDPDPSNRTWHEYASENGSVGDSRIYTSNSTVIAKRVAVFLRAFKSNPTAILTLCEVIIYGYVHYDCARGFTGPGCLLLACDQCRSTEPRCTGEFNSCRYEVCPDQSLLPPDCWITLSNISTLNVSSTTACNSVLFSVALPSSLPNIAASSLQLQVTSSADQRLLDNATLTLQGNYSASYNFSGAASNTAYNVSFKFQYCNVLDRSCFLSTVSQVLTVKTGVRQFVFSHNTSCIFVSAKSTNPECETLSEIQITCEPEVADGVTVSSSTWTVCGLERGQAYHCFVVTSANTETIERKHAYIVMEVLDTSSVPRDDSSVLGGSIGGSIIIVAVIVAIIVVFYWRQKHKARSQTSAVKLGTKANDPDLASAQDVSPSVRKVQDNNAYESLPEDLHLQTTEDYAISLPEDLHSQTTEDYANL